MLCGLLNSHPEILCHHELFHPNTSYFALNKRNGEFKEFEATDTRDAQPIKFLTAIWDRSFDHKAVGFKLLRNQNITILRAMIKDPSVKKIVLERKNYLAVYTSMLAAKKTGQWSKLLASNDSSQKHSEQPTYISPKQFISYSNDLCNYYNHLLCYLKKHKQPFLHVYFEELVANKSKLSDILNFININKSDANFMHNAHAAQNHKIISKRISNAEEFYSSYIHHTAQPKTFKDFIVNKAINHYKYMNLFYFRPPYFIRNILKKLLRNES